MTQPINLIFSLIPFTILIFSIVIHEVAHGWVADYLGDPTARISGRLTLNPIPHLDPLMSILLPLLLYISRSPIIFAVAKPVPIDPFNFRNPKKDMGIVGLAGPGANFILALLGATFLRIISFSPLAFLPIGSGLFFIFKYLVFYNLLLGIFNLLPIPPLDGSRILVALLPREKAQIIENLEPYGFFILFLLLFFPLPFFSLTSVIFGLTQFFFQLMAGIPLV